MAAVVSPTKMSLISADGRYLLDTFKEVFFIMISVGIDVSKGKSTVCAIKPYGEVLMTPRDFKHTRDELGSLTKQLSRFKEEI
nr:transposase [Erysipelotrichaceae bacterium]